MKRGWFFAVNIIQDNQNNSSMFSNLSFIFFKSIKAYGLCSIVYDPFINMINPLDVDLITLSTALAIESIFLFLKYSDVNVPAWIEAVEDLS